jgi:hypothetical protein
MKQDKWSKLREKAFLARFQTVAKELNVGSHHDIESLKFRASTSDLEYKELLVDLKLLEIKEIKGNYDGKAWRLTDTGNNSIIIVEHETGLEIFFIVTGVASIIGAVPTVINAWNRLRNHWPPFRERFGTGGIERRRFDKNNKLIEEPAPSVEVIILQHLLNKHDELTSRVSSIETEISRLNKLDSHPKSIIKKKVKRISKSKQ